MITMGYDELLNKYTLKMFQHSDESLRKEDITIEAWNALKHDLAKMITQYRKLLTDHGDLI